MGSSSRAYAAQFGAAAWIAYRGLFAWLSPFAYFAEKVVTPLGALTFLTLLGTFATGSDTAAFYVLGNGILTAASNGVFAVARAVEEERNMGTLVYLTASPARRTAVFFGRGSLHVVDGVVGASIALLWGTLVFGVDLGGAALPLLLLTVLTAAASVTGLGLFLGSISLVSLGSMFLGNLGLMVLGLVSGANVPLDRLPAPLAALGNALPMTRSIEAAREVVGGGSFAGVWPLLVADVAIGAGYALAGLLLFKALEGRARRHASLDLL